MGADLVVSLKFNYFNVPYRISDLAVYSYQPCRKRHISAKST